MFLRINKHNKIDIFNTPDEFIGKEPSLIQLKQTILLYPTEFIDLDTKVIDIYYKASKVKGLSEYKYYLGGQITIGIEERITEKVMKEVVEANKKRCFDYGDPVNYLEKMSLQMHNQYFENVQKIIDRYYEISLIELYRPPDKNNKKDKGGEFYQLLSSMTSIGKI
jgi:hypothetical protein